MVNCFSSQFYCFIVYDEIHTRLHAFIMNLPHRNMNSFDNPGEGDQNNPRQAEIEQKKLDIACYKHSLELNRIALSKTIWDIRNYCFTNAQNDPLLCPPRDNPYKSQRSCTVI